MPTTHYRSCTLCEATCGIAVEVEGDRVVSVRGDEQDPFSKGYICPKGTALADLHHDPDRLRHPMIRTGERWREATWDEALALTARRLREIKRRHGKDAIGVYQGNPTAHNLGLLVHGQVFLRTLGTKNIFSATSNDSLPHMLAALLVFGNGALMPVPDIDRCDLFVAIGANPYASNGSIMTAPDVKSRLKAIRARGGKIIVIDPRRTETADKADQHLFVRPGTDAVMLLAIIHEVFARGHKLRVPATGLDALRAAASAWTAERAAAITGVSADDVRALARALLDTPRAVVYGRLGVCTQEFGGLAAWLCYALNAITGHLDEPGGLMFTSPALDPLPAAKLLDGVGGFARWRSRVSGKPEFGGELPMAVFAEEIETPGPGQMRALITSAGNPVLSSPGGERIARALDSLEFMVSIDPYLNETTRHAHVILPPTSQVERAHYDVALSMFGVRNVAKYAPPLFARKPDQRHDWEIMMALFARMHLPLAERLLMKLTPERILAFGLFVGRRTSLRALREQVHGIDLGALEPRLPGRLDTVDKKVHLAPAEYLADLSRLARRAPVGGLVLIGRRDLRSNNSWMHNAPRLAKGPNRCTLMIHPSDAESCGVSDGGRAKVSTSFGAIEVPVEVTTDVMRGVVSIPHGYGHDRKGARLSVAAERPGASVNDILDPAVIDELSGTSALTGQQVQVVPA